MGVTRRAHELFGYRLDAHDGIAGRVHDLYFDDRRWLVRYLVVDVRHGLASRRVLISPVCVRGTAADARRFDVALSREQVRRGPDVDTDRPVSRQHEIALHEHYGIPFYWTHGEDATPRGGADPHLRSMRAVRGYIVFAGDSALGHVEDFLVDCGAWEVSDVVVARRRWMAGPRQAVPVGAIARVSWVGKAVYLDGRAVVQTA
jgi:hypothetical protein